MFFCPNCGYKTDAAGDFCPVCGARMVNEAAQAPAYAQQPAYAQPAAPAYAQQPAYAQPAAPAYEQPAAPAYEQPAAPAYEQPAAPAYEQPAAPAYEQPAAPMYGQPQAPMYGQPMYNAPAASEPSKGKAIAGGIIGISGGGLAALGVLFTFIGLITELPGLAFGYALGFGIFSIPLSIVGLILCKGAVNEGTTVGVAKIGKILGLVGIIASGAALLLGCISFGFDDPYTSAINSAYDYYNSYY